MSKLAQKVAKTGVKIPDVIPEPTGQPGTRGSCRRLYGPCDLEDWAAVEALREGRDWHQVQVKLHEILGITETIHKEKFRYHWLRRCACWPAGIRR